MKILAAIPLRYGEEGHYWERDLGVVVLALRALGHEATFVALGEPGDDGGRPLALASLAELGDPRWWQAHRPDAIILNTWGAPRYRNIRLAALSVGCPVIEKLDTDGVKSPRVDFRLYLLTELVEFGAREAWWRAIRVWLRAVARAFVVYSLPALLDRPMVEGLSKVTICAAETPLATARVGRFLRLLGADPMPRVMTIPHPIGSDEMQFRPGDRKQNHLVAVGRWDHFRKGWGLLAKVAREFLPLHPDWKLFVIGSGATALGARLEREFPGRFFMLGRLDHAQMTEKMRAAKIFVHPSFSEGCNLSAAEALCCGCSVVGPSLIPTSSYFASHDSGTPSYRRTAVDLTDALVAEVAEWADGHRDPLGISAHWRGKLSPTSVARRYLEVLGAAPTAAATSSPTGGSA